MYRLKIVFPEKQIPLQRTLISTKKTEAYSRRCGSHHENSVLKAAGRTKRTLTKCSGAPEVAPSVRRTFR